MSMSAAAKMESSVPIQTRISIGTLAELDMYWLEEGRGIRSMSQLVSWSMELLAEILKANNKIVGSIDSVAQAHKYLLSRNLYQPSLFKKRGFEKIGSAIRFENMREVGDDPSSKIMSGGKVENNTTVRHYNMLHNKQSVQPFTGRVDSELLIRARAHYDSLKNKEVEHIVSNESIVGTGTVEERMALSKAVEDKEAEELSKFIAAAKAEKSI